MVVGCLGGRNRLHHDLVLHRRDARAIFERTGRQQQRLRGQDERAHAPQPVNRVGHGACLLCVPASRFAFFVGALFVIVSTTAAAAAAAAASAASFAPASWLSRLAICSDFVITRSSIALSRSSRPRICASTFLTFSSSCIRRFVSSSLVFTCSLSCSIWCRNSITWLSFSCSSSADPAKQADSPTSIIPHRPNREVLAFMGSPLL